MNNTEKNSQPIIDVKGCCYLTPPSHVLTGVEEHQLLGFVNKYPVLSLSRKEIAATIFSKRYNLFPQVETEDGFSQRLIVIDIMEPDDSEDIATLLDTLENNGLPVFIIYTIQNSGFHHSSDALDLRLLFYTEEDISDLVTLYKIVAVIKDLAQQLGLRAVYKNMIVANPTVSRLAFGDNTSGINVKNALRLYFPNLKKYLPPSLR